VRNPRHLEPVNRLQRIVIIVASAKFQMQAVTATTFEPRHGGQFLRTCISSAALLTAI
jgi:hypothetical protein